MTNTPITAQQFRIGNHRLRFGHALDENCRRLPEQCVWRWNGHYWAPLVRNCSDLESAKHSAAQELSGTQ